jgi:hypothetical protein
VSEAQQHSLGIAAVFAATAFGLLAYTTLRPENRPETVRLAISRCVLCAAAFGANAWLAGFEIRSLRLQALAVAPVNLTIVVLVSSVCTLQARSLGTVDISPRARGLLRHTPHVFLVCFSLNLAMSMIWPVPVLERFGAAPAHYLLNRAFVTAAETLFLGVAVFVSWQATGPHEPVGRIRLQHASFLGAHALLVSTALNTYLAVCFRVFVGDDATRRSLIESALARELWLAAGAAFLYAVALALYYTGDGRTRAITRFSKWRRVRRDLDQRLWAMETGAFKRRFPTYDCVPEAARELADRAREEGSDAFGNDQVALALDTFKLCVLAAEAGDRPSRRQAAGFDALPRYHRALLRETHRDGVGWTVATRPGDGDLHYSAESDPLPEAVAKLRGLLSGPSPRRLVAEPQWFQLAAFAAADSGLLPPQTAARVSAAGAVMERVRRAYRNALLAESLSRRSRFQLAGTHQAER